MMFVLYWKVAKPLIDLVKGEDPSPEPQPCQQPERYQQPSPYPSMGRREKVGKWLDKLPQSDLDLEKTTSNNGAYFV